ncbi:MAG: hypothetical protein FJ399_11135 [Verrucomicrobia bacterium]|nr:hypothetical protein [Verrucomicrobiota bacterium]
MPRLPTAIVLLAAALSFLSGCSHYRLGTGAKPAFRTVHVEPVANQTLLPQAQAILSTRLREALARDARVALANSAGDAEATLTVAIADYRREIAAVREDDTGLARKFNVTLGARCSLRDNRTGAYVWENRLVSATREVFTDGGQLQAEYQALPLLSSALSARIVLAVLDAW